MAPRITLDHVGFEAPSGLEDATRYAFVDPQRDEELSVELEAPAGGNTPAEDVVEEVRRNLDGVFQDDFEILDEGPTTLDGRSALAMSYVAGPADARAYGRLVVVNVDGGDFVKLRMAGPDLARLRERLDPSLASVSLHGGPAPTPAGRGYLRRQAGPIAIDLPVSMQPPRSYLFMDRSDQLQLRITVLPQGADAPDLDAEMARDGRGGELLDRSDRSWSQGRWARYRLRGRPLPDQELEVVRARVSIPVPEVLAVRPPTETASPSQEPTPPPSQHVEVYGEAPPALVGSLHGSFDALLRSVREASAR